MPSKVWDEITYTLPKFNGAAIEVWEWIGYFIWHFIMDAITYPCWGKSWTMLIKMGPRDHCSTMKIVKGQKVHKLLLQTTNIVMFKCDKSNSTTINMFAKSNASDWSGGDILCDMFVLPHENNLKCINILERCFSIIWSDVNESSWCIGSIQECVCNDIVWCVLIIMLYQEYYRTCLIVRSGTSVACIAFDLAAGVYK